MTTGKTIALTIQTFVGQVKPLVLNMLSKLVITFLPRSKRLLVSWLKSPSAEKLSQPLFPLFPHLFNSQSYVFSSSHVQMWELDHKEGLALKNWCFQIVVMEKTLESPLDNKDIKPINLRVNKPWIFIVRTDAQAEAPILRPPDMKSWLIGKDPDVGKGWGQEAKGVTENEMVRCHHHLSGCEFEQTPGDCEGKGSL